MKRPWMIASLTVLVISSVASGVLAAEHGGTPISDSSDASKSPAASTPEAKVLSAEGLVTAVAANSVKVTDKLGKEWTLAVDPKTLSVWRNGRGSRFDELKAGDPVKVQYSTRDGKQMARSIEITSPKPVAASSSAPASSAPQKSY